MRLHHLAPGSGTRRDQPVTSLAVLQRDRRLCRKISSTITSESGGNFATSVQPMLTHWCRRTPRLASTNKSLASSKQAMRTRGKGLWWSAWLRWQPKCWWLSCVSGYARPRHPMRTAPSLASGGERPATSAQWNSSVAKQPLQGLTAQPLARLAQRAGADGFVVLPGSASSSTWATFTMERSLSKATPNTSQSACSMGSRRFAAWLHRHLGPVQSLLGYVALNDIPIVQASQTSAVQGTLAAALADP